MGQTDSYIKIRTILERGVYPDEDEAKEAAEDYDLNREMRFVAERYDAENALLSAVASGDEAATREAFAAFGKLMQTPGQHFRLSSRDLFREFKNSTRTINTLFRKAVEIRHVPPYYIHDLTTRYDYDIESAETVDELVAIITKMIGGYCSLVRERSLEKYSELVRRAVLYIQKNLCAEISTSSVAEHLNVTPNYLSNRFKAETGITVTDHIRRHRVEMARGLLRDTSLSVQDVAFQVGIGDAGYFSVQFRKETGISPTGYRKKFATENISTSL